MTAKDFAARHPKPWRLVMHGATISLRSAKGAAVGNLNLTNGHSGIPQKEWNRHVAGVLSELLPVIEDKDETNHRRALIEQRQSGGPLRAKELPPAERIDSASPSPESPAGAQLPRESGKE